LVNLVNHAHHALAAWERYIGKKKCFSCGMQTPQHKNTQARTQTHKDAHAHTHTHTHTQYVRPLLEMTKTVLIFDTNQN
jgi:Zn ribbon nucleic-acid-binding protein